MTDRLLLTFDLDGVLCRPPLGINPGRGIGKRRDREGTKGVLWATERWRYRLRRPMSGAVAGFRALSSEFECEVLSARSAHAGTFTEGWFERHFGAVPRMHLRPGWEETAAAFKARKAGELHQFAHFEDDAHTAAWLAELLPVVFLIDWWRNRWLDLPNVYRIKEVGDALPILHELRNRA